MSEKRHNKTRPNLARAVQWPDDQCPGWGWGRAMMGWSLPPVMRSRHQLANRLRSLALELHTTSDSFIITMFGTNDRALFARFARSNLNFQEPGNGDTKLSGKGRGEDTCYMSHVIQVRRKAWVIASMCLEVHNNCSWYQYFLIKSNYLSKLHFFNENYAPVVLYLDWI